MSAQITTLTASNIAITNNLSVAGTLTTVNLTTTNLIDTNITAGSANITNATIATARITSNLLSNGRLDIGGTQPSLSGSTLGNLFITGSTGSVSGAHLLFNISQDVYPTIYLHNWSHDINALCFDSYFDGNWRTSNSNGGFALWKTAGQLQMKYLNGSAGSTAGLSTGLVMTTGGNVGIGTTAPSATLHLAALPDTFLTLGNGNAACGIKLNDIPGAAWHLNTSGYQLSFANGSVGNYSTKMVLSNTGSLGIGTATPAATLDVAGSIRASGPVGYAMFTNVNAYSGYDYTFSGYGIYLVSFGFGADTTPGNTGISGVYIIVVSFDTIQINVIRSSNLSVTAISQYVARFSASGLPAFWNSSNYSARYLRLW